MPWLASWTRVRAPGDRFNPSFRREIDMPLAHDSPLAKGLAAVCHRRAAPRHHLQASLDVAPGPGVVLPNKHLLQPGVGIRKTVAPADQ